MISRFLCWWDWEVDFSVKDLVFRFRLSEQSVSELFFSWIGYMFCQLEQLSWWPLQDTIISHMPANFNSKFPQCLAMTDCTETKTETPSSLKAHSQCYSDYKSSTILKPLVAADLMGALMSVSALFSGSISDQKCSEWMLWIYVQKDCTGTPQSRWCDDGWQRFHYRQRDGGFGTWT